VPLSEIFLKEPTQDIPFHFKQLWDCFSENVSVITYTYLYERRCQVVLKDGSKVWASYLFTVDWYDNSYSDEPSDYKCGHILVADDGYLLCQPNNRIFWKDSNWVTKDFPINIHGATDPFSEKQTDLMKELVRMSSEGNSLQKQMIDRLGNNKQAPQLVLSGASRLRPNDFQSDVLSQGTGQ
jgi:hypothetical protein